jgi:uncharacterized alpha-E superfamily protein
MERFWQENEAAVARAVECARTQLSPDGWERLEKALGEMRVMGGRVK